MRRTAWLFVALFLLLLALPSPGAAQAQQAQAGRVTGSVVDASGGALPTARVTLTNQATGAARSVTADASGTYAFPDVAAGTYELAAEMSGFTRLTRQVVVAAGQTVTQEMRLEIAALAAEVQVTGTLIPRPSVEAMSPVSTLEPEEIAYRGQTRVEDILTRLPQVFNAQNSTIANGASGTATVDLRYLGAVRTLVLIDGRRMSNGDAFATSPDLNFIPSALVKRVDILTGGASSVYGADAVAGVVNFILDRDFEGIKGGIQLSGLQHNNRNTAFQDVQKARGFTPPTGSNWGGRATAFNVAMGGKFAEGKGHATAYLDYRNTGALLKKDRDYTGCSVGLGANGPICSGSSTVPNGRFLVFSPAGRLVGDYTLDTAGPGNTFRKRTGADVFNYGPFNFMQRPDKRWAGGGFGNYRWNQYAQAYADVMLMDDYTDAQIAPSGDFGNTGLINCDNPMLSAQQRTLLCTDAGYGPTDLASVTVLKRNIEGGPRVAQLRHTAFRLVGGVRGDLSSAWNYDVSYIHAQVQSPQAYANDLNVNRLQDALIVDGDPSDPSTWSCRSGNAGCVPWNIFRYGNGVKQASVGQGITQAALDYLSLPLLLDSGTRTQVFNARLSGDLGKHGVKLGSATEGVRVAFGSEYRKEFLYVNPDLAYREGIGSGQGGPTLPVSGTYDVKEVFAESLIPLVQNAHGAQDVSLELGIRSSEYSTGGRFQTSKVQGSYSPFGDLKFRVGFNRATRAANVQELFVPQGLGLGGNSDICAGDEPTGTREECARTGVTAAQYGTILPNPADQYNTIGGGNPNLTPEIADTFTWGVAVTPKALPGFAATVDFFDIKIEDTIGSLNADDIINSCAKTGNAKLCGLIHRDRLGTLWLTTDAYTITTNQNIGKLRSRGIDLTGTYSHGLANAGTLSMNFRGSYLMKAFIDTGLFSYDCVGFFGVQCGQPTPHWRHLSRFNWETRFNTVLSLGWRVVGPVTIDDASPNPALADPSAIDLWKKNDTYKYSAHHYFDVAANYRVNKNFQIITGINNIFDKEPPLGPSLSINDYGPGYYGTYDPYGRFAHVSLQFTFQ